MATNKESSYQKLKRLLQEEKERSRNLNRNLSIVVEKPESFEGMNIIANVKFNNQFDRMLLLGEKHFDNRNNETK